MELWTYEHAVTLIPAMVVMCIVGALLRWWLGDKDRKVRMIPFQILAAVLFLVEIGKQVLSFEGGYDLYHLPFHFCSLFIFFLPLMAFYRGRHARKVWAAGTAFCFSVTLLMMIYPALIYSADNIRNFFHGYFDFHTVFFHNIVIMESVLIVALGLHSPEAGDTKAAIWTTVGFCVVSASMAHLLKTNFANYYTCNIPPLETVRQAVAQAVGVVPAQLLYVMIVSALNIGFVCMAYWVYRAVRRGIWGKAATTARVS
jgi:hypothetical protein